MHGHAAPPSAERRLLLDKGACLGLSLDGLRKLLRHLHLTVVAFVDVLQRNLNVSASARYPGCDRLGIGYEGIHQQVDVFGIVSDIFVARPLGTTGVDCDFRTVFQRCHFCRDMRPKHTDKHQCDYSENNSPIPALQECAQPTGIPVVHAFEEWFGLAVEPALSFAFLQEFGGKHRRKSEGGKGRDEHRTSHHKAELAEQPAAGAFHEHNGEEHRYQRDGGRHYGKEDFFCPLDACLKRLHTPFDTDVNVFGHHDGIVYHQSYRKHHRQHGQYIDGEPRHVHDKEGTDERDRNHDNRYQRDAPVAQEQEDDDDNQEESLVNGTLHFGNGGTDKAGIVESIRVRHIVGKVFFHLLHTFVHGIGYLDMVGSGLRDDHHAHHRHTVHLHVTLYVGSTQFGIPDIAQADDLSAYFLNYDIVELVGGMHLSHGAQGQFYGISFDASRRKFHVLVVHRILHVNWSHTIARHLYGVEPQAHGIAFLAPYRHAAHIGYGLKLFFYGQVGYLAQF